tara:strand:+ start:9 stop:239 length:231 start_codon:yes stop_codon:yes gene_type:complete
MSNSSEADDAENTNMEKGKDFEIDNRDEKMEAAGDIRIVLPGDFIGEGYIAGHGTYESVKDGKIYANMAGVVHQID